jgi:hypothetical protein
MAGGASRKKIHALLPVKCGFRLMLCRPQSLTAARVTAIARDLNFARSRILAVLATILFVFRSDTPTDRMRALGFFMFSHARYPRLIVAFRKLLTPNENWHVVAVSRTEDLLKVMVANPTMIDAYRSGVPNNGKSFP